MIQRRCLVAAAGLMALPRIALAQTRWPDRPIRLLVPYAAGGPTDAVARILAERMSGNLPERVVVENRAGGGALPGTEAVARAPKDGSVLLFTTVVHAVHRALHGSRLTFDPQADFTPVALIGVVPQVIMVPPSSPVTDIKGLIAYLRAGQYSYGSSGVGGSSHLGIELLKSMTGVAAEHIPYRGTAPAVADLLGGRIAVVMDSVATGAGQVKSGALRGIATTGLQRSLALPDLPTVAETLPGYEATTWNAVLAPAGTLDDMIQAMSRAIWAAVENDTVKAKLEELGVQIPAPEDRNPAAARRFIAVETTKWERLIKEANIVP